MLATICKSCGRPTNNVTSNYWMNVESDGKTPKEFEVATECYAAFVDNNWVKGCAYDNATETKRRVADKLIDNKLDSTVGCDCNCHCGGWDGAGTCKQPCDQCECK